MNTPILSQDCYFEPYLIHVKRAGQKTGPHSTPAASTDYPQTEYDEGNVRKRIKIGKDGASQT